MLRRDGVRAGDTAFHHWESLFGLPAGAVVWERHAFGGCPIVRLVGDPVAVDPALFELSGSTCNSIAAFSMSLHELRDRLSEHGFEQLDSRAADAEVLNPMLARWDRRSAHRPPVQWQLIRYTDPDTGAHRLLSLENHAETGARYRHIRDERWGTWIAYSACLEWLEQAQVVSGIAPWPISYHNATHDLWLPKRMNPPYVIERALVAAAGAPPDEVLLLREAPSACEDAIFGISAIGTRFGPFSTCYDPLLPEGESRTWLRYRLVPRELARIVADKLGCRLADMSRGET